MGGFASTQVLQVAGFERKMGRAALELQGCIKCGLLFSSALLSLRALLSLLLFWFYWSVVLMGGGQRLLECFFSNTELLQSKVCGHVPPSRKVLDWVGPWPSTYYTKYPKYPRFLSFLRTVIRATVFPVLIFLLNTLRKLPVLDVQFVLSSTAELTTHFILCPSIEYVV